MRKTTRKERKANGYWDVLDKKLEAHSIRHAAKKEVKRLAEHLRVRELAGLNSQFLRSELKVAILDLERAESDHEVLADKLAGLAATEE